MLPLFAFDVDDTLEVSRGPVPIQALRDLRTGGCIVGLCGNWAVVVRNVPDWHAFLSFIGPMLMTKVEFLLQLRAHVSAGRYVMVGNVGGDEAAAREAGFEFVKEGAFMAWARTQGLLPGADGVRAG